MLCTSSSVLLALCPALSCPQFQLILHQNIICSFLFNEFLMCSGFGYFSFVKNNDLIGILYRTEPVRHDDNCLPFKECTKVYHDSPFVCSIQSICRFIKKDKIRFFVNSPGDKQSLFLTGTQALSVVPDPGIVT